LQIENAHLVYSSYNYIDKMNFPHVNFMHDLKI